MKQNQERGKEKQKRKKNNYHDERNVVHLMCVWGKARLTVY